MPQGLKTPLLLPLFFQQIFSGSLYLSASVEDTKEDTRGIAQEELVASQEAESKPRATQLLASGQWRLGLRGASRLQRSLQK